MSQASTPESLLKCPYVSRSLVEAPVGLVIVRSSGRVNAMTVSFFSEVAHHPTSLWVSISRDCYTHELLNETGEFSLIMLHHKQPAAAIACGTVSGRERDKCASLDLYEHGEGFLFLRNALSSTACRVFRRVDAGDHSVFLANMLSGDRYLGRTPLRNLLIGDLKCR